MPPQSKLFEKTVTFWTPVMMGNVALQMLISKNEVKYISHRWLHEMCFPVSLE